MSDIDAESDFSLQSDVESLCEFDSVVQESEIYSEEVQLEGK